MKLEDLIKKFDESIDDFLNRIRINYIVCQTPFSEGREWTEVEADTFLAKSRYNKLPINNIFLLNDHANSDIKLQSHESEAMHESLRLSCQFLKSQVTEFCKNGENKYDLNLLLRQRLIALEEEILKMNYNAWLEKTFEDQNDDIYYVLFETKKVWKSKTQVDIQTFCMQIVNFEFSYRRHLISELRACLIDIYSEHLLLPSMEKLPHIELTCKTTDICELLMAVQNAPGISNSRELKAILMGIFGISREEFNKASYEIRNRPNGSKSRYLKKLSDDLDKVPSSQKQH